MRPPKYYDLQFELASPEEMRMIKATRRLQSKQNQDENTRERLDDRWLIAELKNKLLKRNLDHET